MAFVNQQVIHFHVPRASLYNPAASVFELCPQVRSQSYSYNPPFSEIPAEMSLSTLINTVTSEVTLPSFLAWRVA